jgi:hypothetical protein
VAVEDVYFGTGEVLGSAGCSITIYRAQYGGSSEKKTLEYGGPLVYHGGGMSNAHSTPRAAKFMRFLNETASMTPAVTHRFRRQKKNPVLKTSIKHD